MKSCIIEGFELTVNKFLDDNIISAEEETKLGKRTTVFEKEFVFSFQYMASGLYFPPL